MSRSVSIIIPCYNAASFLRETLDSALRQTVAAAEVILVDDGSTDDSAAIAESYGPPIRVLRQPNQGESVARNAGLAMDRVAETEENVFGHRLNTGGKIHVTTFETRVRSPRRSPEKVVEPFVGHQRCWQ